MDALEALCFGFKFEEIVENIDDLPAPYNKGKKGEYGKYGEIYCSKCEIELKIIDGIYICDVCGTVGDSVMVSEWIENIWLRRKKSIYIRSRNIRSRLEKYVHHSHLRYVFEDFLQVVDVMTKHRLIKRNISRYDYYIIRLSSRINALLIKKPKDLVHSKTRKIFDDRLFGRVYPLLGWDKNCKCKYYFKWKRTVKKLFSVYMVYRKWCTTRCMTPHILMHKVCMNFMKMWCK